MSDVETRGVDSSGRAILASDHLWATWEQVVAVLGFEPVITQGSWMSRIPSGGADNSVGVHDKGGCFDLRTWNLTRTQIDKAVRVLREHGCAAWRRDQRHGGFADPHIHFVCGSDHDLAPGAAGQWADYLANGDGLAGSGKDYEWRPSPLVLKPPEGDDMPFTEDELRTIVRQEIQSALNVTQGNGSTLAQNIKRAGDTKELAKAIAADLRKHASKS